MDFDLSKVVETAQYYDSLDDNEQVQESKSIYNQLISSPESISTLLPLYKETDDVKAHIMILKIIYHRIHFYSNLIEDEAKDSLLSFLFNDIQEMLTGNEDKLLINHLSMCQAQLGSYTFPSEFENLWDYATELENDYHFCYFVLHFYQETAHPNFDNIEHYQQIRDAMFSSDIDNNVFGRIINIFESSHTEDLTKLSLSALSSYTLWGKNYREIINVDEENPMLEKLPNYNKYQEYVDLFNNIILRLNIESEEFIDSENGAFNLESVFTSAKEYLDLLISNRSPNKNNNYLDYLRKTANLINTIFLTLDHDPDFIDHIGAIPQLINFITIQDDTLTHNLIPALSFYIQKDSENQEIIQSILERISIFFQNKNDFNMENDTLVRDLCNALSKANPDVLFNTLNQMLDEPNFINDPSNMTAVLSCFSYIKSIPIPSKYEVFEKIKDSYNDLSPGNYQQFFRSYYLLLFLQNCYFISKRIPEDASEEDKQQITDMNNLSKDFLSSIHALMTNEVMNQFNVICSEDFEYQFLKPVRKIISKIRFSKLSFSQDLVQGITPELTKLPNCPEEAAKIIGYLLDDNTIGILGEIIPTLEEQIQQSTDVPLLGFSLTLISSLKYVDLSQEIVNDLISPFLDGLHSIVADLKFDQLSGLLFKAYAIIASLNENINTILQQLFEELVSPTDRYSLSNSFSLISSILKNQNPSELEFIGELIPNATGILNQNILISYPFPEDKSFIRDLSINYSNFLKSYFLSYVKNELDIGEAFNNMYEAISRQLELSYRYPFFLRKLLESFIFLMVRCEVPPGEIVENLLFQSLSFLFNEDFNPAYSEHQELLEGVLNFHSILAKDNADSFDSKVEQFLGNFQPSQRTNEYVQTYVGLCLNTDQGDTTSLASNEDVLLFYNSAISDCKSCSFESYQTPTPSQNA